MSKNAQKTVLRGCKEGKVLTSSGPSVPSHIQQLDGLIDALDPGTLPCPTCGVGLATIPCPLLARLGIFQCPHCGPITGLAVKVDLEGFVAQRLQFRQRAFLAFVSLLLIGFVSLLFSS